MKVNCKNEGQLQSFKREQFAVRNVRSTYDVCTVCSSPRGSPRADRRVDSETLILYGTHFRV